jgi:hypothetical protein
MTGPTNGNVPELAGSQDVEGKENFIADSAANVGENQPNKPELDLKSWAALGAGVKPSRTNRRVKRGWKKGGSK